jgi:hypothetical protein
MYFGISTYTKGHMKLKQKVMERTYDAFLNSAFDIEKSELYITYILIHNTYI